LRRGAPRGCGWWGLGPGPGFIGLMLWCGIFGRWLSRVWGVGWFGCGLGDRGRVCGVLGAGWLGWGCCAVPRAPGWEGVGLVLGAGRSVLGAQFPAPLKAWGSAG